MGASPWKQITRKSPCQKALQPSCSKCSLCPWVFALKSLLRRRHEWLEQFRIDGIVAAAYPPLVPRLLVVLEIIAGHAGQGGAGPEARVLVAVIDEADKQRHGLGGFLARQGGDGNPFG